ncbi:MAG: hypothetical protein Q9227_008532 [Pyrenula ochraceoflavens]
MATTATPADRIPTDLNTNSNGTTPYGTRSRNRTGGTRPNYAEDHEMDIDDDRRIAPTKPFNTRKAATVHSEDNLLVDGDKAQGVNTRRGFNAVNAPAVPNGNVPAANKDAIPGTSSFSAAPVAAATSKKRKQPGGSVISATTSPPSHHIPTKTRSVNRGHNETNMMTFENCGGYLKDGELIADDGTRLSANDHAFFICEPPGEPYYLARIMQFLPTSSGPVESIRVNWYYRPRDIQRRVQDSRVLFASMHSDTCPLTSLRGKCEIRHVSEIDNLEEYRKSRDCFWFEKLYDRYMHRYYEIIPTKKVINVPKMVKKALDERWKFVLTEIGRTKELTRDVKSCKRCGDYAANNDSVDCAHCGNTFHMTCVRPPLLKKPARGFAWSCASCSRAQERKIEARSTPLVGEIGQEEEELIEEEEDQARGTYTRASTAQPEDNTHPAATAEQIAQASLWPYRYFGMHSKPEDALDYDDRIYPRASSRLGPRHQANVTVWPGQPVELVKPSEIKKKYVKTASHKKDAKTSKDTTAVLEADKEAKLTRPKWVQDEPPGYIPRGEDAPIEIRGKKEHTAQLTFRMPDSVDLSSRAEGNSHIDHERLVDAYMQKVRELAPLFGLQPYSTNLLTKALEILCEKNYDSDAAIARVKSFHLRSDLKEPDLNREEVKRFEEGVAKYGSELYNVTKHVGNIKHNRIVRFYYMWKKTDRGQQIWGNYEGRKSKKEAKRTDELKAKDANASKLLDDVADDCDDSAFDNNKAAAKGRGFECKFCMTRSSRQWRRAPATAPGTMVPRDYSSKATKDKSSYLNVALCHRCALLWRKYGIQWESIEEVSKKIAASGGRAWKRKVDEELIRALIQAQEDTGETISSSTAAAAASAGVEVPAGLVQVIEPPKKKVRADKEQPLVQGEELPPEKKKIVPEKPAEPEPLKPEPPRVKTLPCAVCWKIEMEGDELLNCRDCRMAVHKSCYGVSPTRNLKKWICDMCSNDRNPMVSTTYECVLCPVTDTPHELMEPPKISHKKKTDREREKERKEREMVDEAIRLYRQQQQAAGRPENPREPLKRTAGNNWVHVYCAVWMPEIKFSNPLLLEPAEGIGSIPSERFEGECHICHANSRFPLISCHLSTCGRKAHIGCAFREYWHMGFDVHPVKSTRRDAVNTMKLGEENGFVQPAIWCNTHTVPTVIHQMSDWTEDNMPALLSYALHFKQADLSMTGTVRRAAQMQLPTHTSAQNHANAPNRRTSLVNGGHHRRESLDRAGSRNVHTSPSSYLPNDDLVAEPDILIEQENLAKECYSCKATASPKWWPVESRSKMNGTMSTDLSDTQPLVNGNVKIEPSASSQAPSGIDGAVRVEKPTLISYQCHKCHINKRSPSGIKSFDPRRPPPPAPNGPFPTAFYPTAPPPHPHMSLHGHPPPGPAPSWPPQATQWRPEPVPPHMRNGAGPMPAVDYRPPFATVPPPPNSRHFPPVPHPMLHHNQGPTPYQPSGPPPPYPPPPPRHPGPPPPYPPPPPGPRPYTPNNNAASPAQVDPQRIRASLSPRPSGLPTTFEAHSTSTANNNTPNPAQPGRAPRTLLEPYAPQPPPGAQPSPGAASGSASDSGDRDRDRLRPTTPGDLERDRDRPLSSSGGRLGGASASPNLRNLLS